MARSKNVERMPGIEAIAAGGAASTQNSGWHVPHIPRWLLYSGLGLTALVAAYVGVQLVTAAPQSRTQPQVNPPAITTLVGQPTPVVTSIMPGLENILTEQQLIEYANSLKTSQPITQEALDKIVAINKTLYNRFTGNTIENAKFTIRLLPSEEYNKFLESEKRQPSDGTISFGPNGVTYLNIRLNKNYSPVQILVTLAHETGNAEADRRSLTPAEGFKIIPDYRTFLKEVEQKNNLGNISDVVKTEYLQWIEREHADALQRCGVSQVRRVRSENRRPPEVERY